MTYSVVSSGGSVGYMISTALSDISPIFLVFLLAAIVEILRLQGVSFVVTQL
jgi:hypothetical protein